MLTGASNLAFFVIVASGPFLWWPGTFTPKQLRGIAWFKRGLSSKARDFNWHNTVGIWCAIPLLVIVGSGVVMSYPWANSLVYRVAGEQPPAAQGRGAAVDGGRAEAPIRRPEGEPSGRAANQANDSRGPAAPSVDARDATGVASDALIARAAEQRPAWRTLAIRLPLPSRGAMSVTVDEGDGGQPQKRGTLTLDRETGAVIKWESQAGRQQVGVPARGFDLRTRVRSTVSPVRPPQGLPRSARFSSRGLASPWPSVACSMRECGTSSSPAGQPLEPCGAMRAGPRRPACRRED